MEKTRKKAPSRGGARQGAGRPKGRKNHISVESLQQEILSRSNGQDYEAILVEDFLAARDAGDKQLILKYHNLLLNKLMNTLAKIEVTDSADAVEAKKLAFAQALAKLTGVEQE